MEYRHRHIARCLLKGLSYNQIEQPAEHNKPDWLLIEKYYKQYCQRLNISIEEKLYVLVRNDLTRSQKTVQSVHAACELMLRFRHADHSWDNGTVICKKVDDEKNLFDCEFYLSRIGKKYEYFKEPDFDNKKTGISFLSYVDIFENLPLL